MPPADPVSEETTCDAVLGGRAVLRQSARGYRAGLDAALLAAACDAAPGQRVLDAGCGPGAVMICAALRRPETLFVGVDNDAAAVTLARGNIEANGLQNRIEVERGRVGLPAGRIARAPFDAALVNPPFFDDPSALRGPAPAREQAWHSAEGLAAWLSHILRSLLEGGTITVIHRADKLADLLTGLGRKAGGVQLLPINPFAGDPAKRVLVRAVKSSRAPLRLLPPLVLHERGAPTKHLPATEAILRGDAAIGWLPPPGR